ncbi:hypothetical protein JOF29_005564 [Kribbella aluminosa]|uniref:Uncharacterized protein n=1 Tax=Kribbella aluminosa TaxID=416017 RepID=A0ABS4US36_9ACTN|nr:hypothetical protein [Kribbella aluminosa]MBP2354454.1 hypothetical protein [Kribbella aluminosa]
MIMLGVLVALVCWGLNRNHRRQIRPTVADLTDRDLQRLIDDLRASS